MRLIDLNHNFMNLCCNCYLVLFTALGPKRNAINKTRFFMMNVKLEKYIGLSPGKLYWVTPRDIQTVK
jgi:hypothetical protein